MSTIYLVYVTQRNSSQCSIMKCLQKVARECISNAQCKTAVTPLLTHCSYCSLALSHWFVADCCDEPPRQSIYVVRSDHYLWYPELLTDLCWSMVIPMLKIRRSRDRLIFNMGIPILVSAVYSPGWLVSQRTSKRRFKLKSRSTIMIMMITMTIMMTTMLTMVVIIIMMIMITIILMMTIKIGRSKYEEEVEDDDGIEEDENEDIIVPHRPILPRQQWCWGMVLC